MTSDSAVDCFLCTPDERLIASRGAHFQIIAGLGPLVENYCLIGTLEHAPSMADFCSLNPEALDEFDRLRHGLEGFVGPSIVTEHGKVPVCRDEGDQHDGHCFHAHALVFPGASDIRRQAQNYYRKWTTFDNLKGAMIAAADTENYFLVSPSADSYTVFSAPLNAPRQLARSLIALQIARPDLADWRSAPEWEQALRVCEGLRAGFEVAT